jgi:hypothetical protein
MPDLDDLFTETEETDAKIGGGTVHLVYDPNYLTPKMEEAIEDAPKEKRARMLATIVSEMVSDWDMTRGGETFPPTLENCKSLPIAALGDIITAVAKSGQPDEEEGKASPAT